MAITQLIVIDGVHVFDLFRAARDVAGTPAPPDGQWALIDKDATQILRAPCQAGSAETRVHFAAPIGPVRVTDDNPPGSAHVDFETPGDDVERHAVMVEKLGAWLDERALRYTWRHDAGPWTDSLT